jgi:hypothetical protein
MRILLLSTAIFVLASCKGLSGQLAEVSAAAIGNVVAADVDVTHVERPYRGISWDATTSQGLYKCHTNDKPEEAVCTKQ